MAISDAQIGEGDGDVICSMAKFKRKERVQITLTGTVKEVSPWLDMGKTHWVSLHGRAMSVCLLILGITLKAWSAMCS